MSNDLDEMLEARIDAWKKEGLSIMYDLLKLDDSARVNDAQDLIINGLGIKALEVRTDE